MSRHALHVMGDTGSQPSRYRENAKLRKGAKLILPSFFCFSADLLRFCGDQAVVRWVLIVGLLGLTAQGWAQDPSTEGSAGTEATASTSSPEGGGATEPQQAQTTPEAGTEQAAQPTEPAVGAEAAAPTEGEAATAEALAAPAGEGLISVDFKDADIRQVLRIISLKSGVDIVAGTDVEGLVSIKLTNVPWEQALGIILRTYGFTYERQENIVRVMTLDALEQEALQTRVFPLDYAKAKEVPDIINEMLSDRGRVKFDERTNTIIVTDIPTTLFQIEEVVERLDQRTPQVLIATKVVETKLEKDENLGIRWEDAFSTAITETTMQTSFPFKQNSTLGFLGKHFLSSPVTNASTVTLGTLTGPDFDVALNFLKQRSDTKIVSNPTLAVLNNQEAKIHVGEEFPVPNFSVDPQTGNTTVSGFQTKTVGTVLTVTPHVNPSREIVVDLKPEIIAVLSNATFQVTSSSTVSLPRFSTQTVKTQVRISDGDTIAIGGLVKDDSVIQENKVPLLGDLPLVGVLFKNTHRFAGGTNPQLKQDLLIFLTVKLMGEKSAEQTIASKVTEGP